MTIYSVIYKVSNGTHERIDLATANSQFQADSFLIGASSPVTLTKAIFSNLINLQNGSDFSVGTNSHTHDGRYYTQSQLNSAVTTTGSSLIGDNNNYTNFTPTASNVKGALAGIDAALATVGISNFSDSVFRVHNNADATKIINFSVANVATATTRTITFPNFNVDLGGLLNQNIASGAAIALNKLSALTANRALISDGSGFISASATTNTEISYVAGVTSAIQTQIDGKLSLSGGTMTGVLNMGGFKITSLGSPTLANDAVTKAYVDAMSAGNDFQPDINDYVANATTTAPGTGLPAASTGQRYILASGTGSLNVAWGTITGVGNNDIVQYNGTAWVVAYDVSVQGEGALTWNQASDYFMKWDGTNWTEYGGLSGVTAGIGLSKTGNVLDVNLGAGIVELPTDGVGIDLYTTSGMFLTSDGTTPSTASNAQLSLLLDGSTLSKSSSGLKIAATGVTATELASDAVTTAKILNLNVTQGKIAAGAINDSKIDNTSNLYKNITVTQLGAHDAVHYHNVTQFDTLTAGESFATGIYFCYMADAAGSARVFKATNDRSVSDKYEVFVAVEITTGTIATAGTISTAAGDDIYLGGVITYGSAQITAAQVGLPVFLGTGGSFTLTAPAVDTTPNLAVVRLGHFISTTQLVFDPQVVARS